MHAGFCMSLDIMHVGFWMSLGCIASRSSADMCVCHVLTSCTEGRSCGNACHLSDKSGLDKRISTQPMMSFASLTDACMTCNCLHRPESCGSPAGQGRNAASACSHLRPPMKMLREWQMQCRLLLRTSQPSPLTSLPRQRSITVVCAGGCQCASS